MTSHPFSNIPKGKLGKQITSKDYSVVNLLTIWTGLETLNALQAQYVNDPHPSKTDLMVGVYRNDEGHPFVLPSVKMVCNLGRLGSYFN
jgi:hypothetical protein